MTGDLKDIFPDFVMMAAAFGVPAKRVVRPEDLRSAIQCARCAAVLKLQHLSGTVQHAMQPPTTATSRGACGVCRPGVCMHTPVCMLLDVCRLCWCRVSRGVGL